MYNITSKNNMIHWSTVEGSHRSFKPTHCADQSLPQLVFQSCDWGWIAAIKDTISFH